MIIYLVFYETKTVYTKLVSETVYKCHIKVCFELFVSIYHLYHLFGIKYKSIFYNLNITLNITVLWNHQCEGNFIWKCPLGFRIFSCSLTYCFQFSVFSYSNASIALILWYPFPFCSIIILDSIIKMELVKQWIATIK